ncbi:MAG: alginate lyase family protein, partial [Bacteroidota bacterium]
MSKVNQAYNKDNYQGALKELLKVYQQKENLYLRSTSQDKDYLEKNYANEIERSIKIADEVVNKYFIFREEWDMERTNIPYQFKNQIDWGINPFGDPEWTWMLNRHKYWIHLGKAYFFTGKEKYAKTFVKQATHWIDNNPLPSLKDEYRNTGAWRTIETGIRAENWIKSFEFIKSSKYITPKFLEKFLNSLYRHAEYIANNYSNFSRTSNWGILENHGLFNLSVFLNEFKQASEWQNKAINRLNTCIRLQVLEDGTHWEHSPMYHNEVMHCFLNINLLSQRRKIGLPDILVQKTKDMAYANVEWQKPNYHQPLLGDSDDTDTRNLLTIASYLFGDPVMKSRSRLELDFEDYLILGSNGSTKYRKIDAQKPNFLSVYQQNSGDFYMRSSWNEDATYASLHLKKLAAGHAHDDLLSFTIFANGKDYLIDSGRYTYVDNEWRELLKSNLGHNTLGVDDLPNSIYNDSWLNNYEAWSEDIYTKSGNSFDYGEATNSGYKRLEDPVYMKRRMFFIKPNIWVLFDSFSGKEEHKYSQYFNFPNKKIQIKDNSLSTTYRNQNLNIKPVKNVEIKLSDSW